MRHAFYNVGIEQRDVDFNIALAKYINSGGTYSGARALIDAAEKLAGGQSVSAISDRHVVNASSQPVEDGEAIPFESKDQGSGAKPSSPSRDGGQIGPAYSSHRFHAPVREPTHQQRSAIAAVAKISVMKTWKIDGRPIGDWTISEARQAGKSKTRDGYVLLEAARYVANSIGHEKIAEVVSEKAMQQIIQKSAEVADAA